MCLASCCRFRTRLGTALPRMVLRSSCTTWATARSTRLNYSYLKETLIKFSFSTASRDTVAPDETGDPGDDDRIRAVHKENAAGCFLEEMGQVVPWGELCALIEPHYPKAGGGRPPVGVER